MTAPTDPEVPDVDESVPDPSRDAVVHQRRVRRFLAAGAGIAVGVVGIGIGELVAGTHRRLRSPILDVGDRVVDRVPGWVKDVAIEWFGTNDKLALLIGTAALIVLATAAIGVIGLMRRLCYGMIGVAAFGVVGSWAALGARTGRDWLTPLPSLAGAAFGAAALWFVSRSWPPTGMEGRPGDARPAAPRSEDRRSFIVGTSAVAGVGVVALAAGRRLESRFDVAGNRKDLVLPRADEALPPITDGPDVDAAAPFYTPNDEFYRIDTALSVPQLRASDLELTVTGMVDSELRLSFDDILRRRLVESDITLTCVSNTIGGDLVGNARWLGIRLDELLHEAGIDPAADQIVGRSVDGYTCGFPVEALDGRDALVAIGMNGEPLPVEHGYPARLIVPGIYGYASATKWLTEIELTTFDDFDHYWVPRGYAALAPIKIQSRIDTPRGLQRIPAGPFTIGGVAWAQPVGISAVEIRIDDGDWVATELGDEVNGSTWRQWSRTWDAAPGRHTIVVRGISHDGAIQTDERSEPLPDGATGHHTVVVLVDEA